MEWRVRRAGEADGASLSLVAGATFLETFAGLLAGPDIVRHVSDKNSPATFAAWLADLGSIVSIAEASQGAAPVGYSVLTPPDLPVVTTAADIELKRIYTLARTHGTGLGTALMEMAVRDGRGLGRDRMLLGVYAENQRARAFYEKQGFSVVGSRKFRVGTTECDDLIYALPL